MKCYFFFKIICFEFIFLNLKKKDIFFLTLIDLFFLSLILDSLLKK
jgi:hypothetical protein